jgi:hypothetical protein
MKRFVVDGSAPHYTELAIDLGVHPGAALALLHEVRAMALPNWLHPDTDLIASFAPFSNLPTPYRVSVSGRPHTYAQCGLESLAISWLFPDQEIRVDSRCLDCGEPVALRMRDGKLLDLIPASMVAHINIPVAQWRDQYPRA